MTYFRARLQAVKQGHQKPTLHNEDGAIDLASIMVGIIVIGIIGGVVAATIFAIIPWAQDHEAKASLDSVATAEGAAGGFNSQDSSVLYEDMSHGDNSDLVNHHSLIHWNDRLCADISSDGRNYNGYVRSKSGNYFAVDDTNTVATKMEQVTTPSDGAAFELDGVCGAYYQTTFPGDAIRINLRLAPGKLGALPDPSTGDGTNTTAPTTPAATPDPTDSTDPSTAPDPTTGTDPDAGTGDSGSGSGQACDGTAKPSDPWTIKDETLRNQIEDTLWDAGLYHNGYADDLTMADADNLTNSVVKNSQMSGITLDGVTSAEGLEYACNLTYLESARVGGLKNFDGLQNITHVLGLSIEGSTVDSLAGLKNIKHIDVSLVLAGDANLQSLEGLDNIDGVFNSDGFNGGGITITSMPALTSISGLGGVTRVMGTVSITNNPALGVVNGLNNLVSIESSGSAVITVGVFDFEDNGTTDLEGFDSLKSVSGGFTVAQNYSMARVNAFHKVRTIGGTLSVSSNYGVQRFTGFESLVSTGGFTYTDNDNNVTNSVVRGFQSFTTPGSTSSSRTKINGVKYTFANFKLATA